MDTRQFITIHIPSNNERFDLEVPAGRRIDEILPLILKGLNYPPVNPTDGQPYALWTSLGEKLKQGQSFQQAGISNFGLLIVDSKAPKLEKQPQAAPAMESTISKEPEQVVPPETEPAITSKVEEEASSMPASGVKGTKKSVQELVAVRKKPGVIVPGQTDDT